MFDIDVNAEQAVLELGPYELNQFIRIHNNPNNPAETIYIILPTSIEEQILYWYSTTSLSGPKADLIILTQSDLSIKDVDFRNFRNILVSDNKFYQEGSQFVVIKDDEYTGRKITFENCRANNAYFLCNSLKWLSGAVKEDLFVKLHGNNTELQIEGIGFERSVVGNLIIPENTKPQRISLKTTTILHNFTCEGVETLFIQDLKTGDGTCKLIATEIERLANFQNLSDSLIIKAEIANISSFITPRGKVQIDINSFIEFTSDGDGRFQGIELNIDVSRAIEKAIKLPFGTVYFDKIHINGASILDVPGFLIAKEALINNCSDVSLDKIQVGQLTYKAQSGNIFFGKNTGNKSIIDSLWLIGNISATFYGQSEVSYLETDEGRCSIHIYDAFKAILVNLNLNLDPKKQIFDSEKEGYFGFYVSNPNNKEVVIETILAKLTNFYIDGRVKLGKVMCQPIDSKYNLIEINVKHLNHISIDEFFVGFDHNIVIDKTTGKISLVQSMDRALQSGAVIAQINCSLKHFLTIKAKEGLSFHGNIDVIDGDIELFALFKRLSVSGSLKASRQIKLLALEGSLDLSATCNAVSIITYAKNDSYIHDTYINSIEFLSSTVGRYILISSNISSSKATILSENDSIMFKASSLHISILQTKAKEDIKLETSTISSNSQTHSGNNVYVENASNVSGDNTSFSARRDVAIVDSKLSGNRLSSNSGRDIRFVFSQTSNNYVVNEAEGDISIRASTIHSSRVANRAGRDIEIASSSEIVSSLLTNYSGSDTRVTDSSIYSSYMILDSKEKITIDNSLLLSDHNMFFQAISNYLAINSNISLTQYPYKLFLHKTGIDNEGNPLLRCGFSIAGIEVIGMMGAKGYNQLFAEFQYTLVNSSNIDLGIFAYLSGDNPKAIIIDAATAVIMGSLLNAKNHHVIIKAKHGIEILPLGFYNGVMFSGGFNEQGITNLISKIEAGFIDLDGGTLIKSVGALMRAAHGSLKADYIITESLLTEISAKQRSLKELAIWLNNRDETYEMIVNSNVVPTRLEFSEVTKIDLGKGKVDLFYPYQSKEVYLRQREGDVNIGKDVHFPYQVMALHLDQGKIFFGMPKTESILLRFFWKSYVREHHTIEHVSVSGHDLRFSATGGIELHGQITATGSLDLQSSGSIKIAADRHNFGKEVRKSVIRSDNAYITGDNIEIIGSLIIVKNNLKLISDNDIKIIPIELIHRYSGYCGSKTFTREMSIKQVVSEINAGMINIDAARAAEFIGCLIEAESLNMHVKDLKIASAKEIFEKQIEFQGAKKWYGGGGRSSSDYSRHETVIPAQLHIGKLRMLVDQNATIEASQIFARDEVLTKIGGNFVIKDGYNLHIHDHQAKKYSLLSFANGGVKFNNNKSIRNITETLEGIPTLVCAGGIFHGFVEGRMHVLGSTIIGKDIHLVVPNGLKLEASKHTDKDLTFVSETGFKLGFYCKGKQEAGIKMAAFASADDQERWHQHLTQTVIAAEDSLNILVRDGSFEQISSQLAARIIYVEARNWIAKTYDEQVVSEHIHQHVEAGVKIAIKQTVTSAIDKAKMLINKKGSHVIDNADRIFKAYDVYKSFAVLPTSSATGGAYAYLEASQSSQLEKTSVAVDNTINGKTIIARIKEDIRFQGVQMTAKDVDLEAVNFTFETSKDIHERECDFGRVDIDIGIYNPALSTGGLSENSSASSAIIHHKNYIKVSGNLKITLAGDGKFKGVSLEGTNVDISATNLILESVQDIITRKMNGSNFHIGLNQEYGLQGLSAFVESGSGKSAWTNQIARIIGSHVVNIAVLESLELAGSLIASAEEDKKGTLTDKGNLSINCGRLVVKTIHDYDKGLTLGIGLALQISQNQKGENEIDFNNVPLKVEFKDHKRALLSTIGKGIVNNSSDKILGDELNRDVTKQIQLTKEESAKFDAPIHADMLATLTGQKTHKEPPKIKEIARDTTQEQTLPLLLSHYFTDVVDSFKGALKDSIIDGSKAANSVGGKIDAQSLDMRIHQLFDWQYGTKLSTSDIKRIEDAYALEKLELAKTLEDLATKEQLDLNNEEQKKSVTNKAKYHKFFEKFQNKIKDASENKPELLAALQIYKTFYLKELKQAKEQNRPVKEFQHFIKDTNHNNIYSSAAFAEKIHPFIAETLGEIELLFSNSAKVQQKIIETKAKILPPEGHDPLDVSFDDANLADHNGRENKVDETNGQEHEQNKPSKKTLDTKQTTKKLLEQEKEQQQLAAINYYTLLSLAQDQQKQVELSKETTGLLTSMFRVAEQQTQEANDNSNWTVADLAQGFDHTGLSMPKVVNPGWQPTTLKDVGNNLSRDFLNPSSRYHGNLPLAILSSGGELLEYGGQRFAHIVSHIEGGQETLAALGFALGKVTNLVAKIIFTEKELQNAIEWHQTLPHGAQILVSATVDGAILYGAGTAFKVAINGVSKSKMLLAKAPTFELLETGESVVIKQPSMLTKFRKENISNLSNQSLTSYMHSEEMQIFSKLKGSDCSEIAEKILNKAQGNGVILEVKPNSPHSLKIFENGIESGELFEYHQVYTDGRYVYDPRLSNNPVPKGDWEKLIKKMNSDGVTIKTLK